MATPLNNPQDNDSSLEPVLENILQDQHSNAEIQHSLEENKIQALAKIASHLKDQVPVQPRIVNDGEVFHVKGIKGDQGNKGEKGDKGDKGDQGIQGTPGEDSFVAGPQGEQGIQGPVGPAGKDGLDGKDGIAGTNGKDGKDGSAGKDGSPDTGEQIINKVNASDAQIDAGRIKGLFKGNQIGYLRELADVAFTSLTNGQALVYDATTNKWKNGTVSGGGGGTWGTITGTIASQSDLQPYIRGSVSAGTGISYNSTTGVITSSITQYTDALARASLSAGAGISYNSTTGVITSSITQYTDALARAAHSLTTTGTSGAATYNSTTGVLNIPQYAGTVYTGTTNRITVTGSVIDIAATYVGQTSITTLGTITSGTWNGTAIAATNGGTGQTTYAVGDLLYASTSSALSKLAGVATGNVLISGGVGTAPSYGKVGLTTHISGTLPVANGGTGIATLTAGYIPYGNGTSAFGSSANFVWDNTNNYLSLGTSTSIRFANGTKLIEGNLLGYINTGNGFAVDGTSSSRPFIALSESGNVASAAYFTKFGATSAGFGIGGYVAMTFDGNSETFSFSSQYGGGNIGGQWFFTGGRGYDSSLRTAVTIRRGNETGGTGTPNLTSWQNNAGSINLAYIDYNGGAYFGSRIYIANNVGTTFLNNYTEYQIITFDGGTAALSYGTGIIGNTMVFNSGGGAYNFDKAGASTQLSIAVDGTLTGVAGAWTINTGGYFSGTASYSSGSDYASYASYSDYTYYSYSSFGSFFGDYVGEINANSYSILGIGLGTVADPGISFYNDSNTGIYSAGADTLNFATAGVNRVTIGSTGNVGVGGTATSTLHVSGSFATAYRAITSARTLDATDQVINCTSGTFTVTLPTAVGISPRRYDIKNSGTGVITLATTSSQTIDGSTTATLDQYESLTVVSDGANWIII